MSEVPRVEWLYDPYSWDRYGVICLAGKWAAVKSDDSAYSAYALVTDWLDSREAAIGFVKLLREAQ